MTNKDIAKEMQKLAKIMELHDANPFKVKGYTRAYLTLRNISDPLFEMSKVELESQPGIGKSIASKIVELQSNGKMDDFEKYASITPPGILELLNLKGFGPKKIKQVWNELGIESAGELLYACEENRLVELKGFGAKSQLQLVEQLQYFIQSRGKYLYAQLIDVAHNLIDVLHESYDNEQHSLIGDLVMQRETAEYIEILTTCPIEELVLEDLEAIGNDFLFQEKPVKFQVCSPEDFYFQQYLYSSSEEFTESLQIPYDEYTSEAEIFEENDISYVYPEMREKSFDEIENRTLYYEKLGINQIKGVIHSHSLYSDGANTIKDMALASQAKGYEYLVMTDHSKAAFYANGLNEERLLMQWSEIDSLNKELGDFKILKGIESDILNDGQLDYEDEVLAQFDVIIASVHSNLKMTEEKAMKRLIKAIENPYTHILGHATGRILLARKGYPIDHYKIIDACAENHVAIELNANPSRLDMDWRYLDYALEKGVLIGINPDAHSIKGIDDIQYGLAIAQKLGITADECLNCKSWDELLHWISLKQT